MIRGDQHRPTIPQLFNLRCLLDKGRTTLQCLRVPYLRILPLALAESSIAPVLRCKSQQLQVGECEASLKVRPAATSQATKSMQTTATGRSVVVESKLGLHSNRVSFLLCRHAVSGSTYAPSGLMLRSGNESKPSCFHFKAGRANSMLKFRHLWKVQFATFCRRAVADQEPALRLVILRIFSSAESRLALLCGKLKRKCHIIACHVYFLSFACLACLRVALCATHIVGRRGFRLRPCSC